MKVRASVKKNLPQLQSHQARRYCQGNLQGTSSQAASGVNLPA